MEFCIWLKTSHWLCWELWKYDNGFPLSVTVSEINSKDQQKGQTSAKFQSFNFFTPSIINAFLKKQYAHLYDLFMSQPRKWVIFLFMEKGLIGDPKSKISHYWKITTIYIFHIILKCYMCGFFFVLFSDFIAYRSSNRFLQLVKLNCSRMSLSTCCGHIMLHQAYPFIITVKPALKGSIIFPIN
jgi:hypothetical protein